MRAIMILKNAGMIDSGIFNDVEKLKNNQVLTVAIYARSLTPDPVIFKGSEIISYIPMTVCGKTYQERKNDIQNKAIEWSYTGGAANWSYSELSEIQSFFEVNGKRYGLIKEFKENAIC